MSQMILSFLCCEGIGFPPLVGGTGITYTQGTGTIAVDFNSTNLRDNAGQIDTIQDIATTSDVNFNDITAAGDMFAGGNLDSNFFGAELLNTGDDNGPQSFNITPSEGVAIVTVYVRDGVEFDTRQFIVSGTDGTGNDASGLAIVGEIVKTTNAGGGSLFSFVFTSITSGVINCTLDWVNVTGVVKMRVKQWFGAAPTP